MAYINLSGKRDTDPAEASNKMLLSDEDYNRVAFWGAKTFFPNGILIPGVPGSPEIPAVPDVPEVPAQDAVLDADGNVVTPAVEYQPAIPGTPGVPAVEAIPDSHRQPTGEEVFKAITDYVYADIRQKAFQLELRLAQEAAAASVKPVDLTPAV